MAETVTDADLRGLLDVIDAARGRERGDAAENGGLPAAMLDQLCRVVPCDSVSFLDLDPRSRTVNLGQEWRPGDDTSGSGQVAEAPGATDDADADDGAFWRNYDACIGCSYPTSSGDDVSVTTMSDFYSRREYRSTGMYAEYLGPLGIEHEAMVCLPAPPGRSRRLVLFRSGRTDFGARDRLLLALLRPHLAELDRELARRRTAAGLTPRQLELLRLVARGDSNVQIARALQISPGTVRKHLENIFTRLGVMSRTAAVAKALPAEPGHF